MPANVSCMGREHVIDGWWEIPGPLSLRGTRLYVDANFPARRSPTPTRRLKYDGLERLNEK